MRGGRKGSSDAADRPSDETPATEGASPAADPVSDVPASDVSASDVSASDVLASDAPTSDVPASDGAEAVSPTDEHRSAEADEPVVAQDQSTQVSAPAAAVAADAPVTAAPVATAPARSRRRFGSTRVVPTPPPSPPTDDVEPAGAQAAAGSAPDTVEETGSAQPVEQPTAQDQVPVEAAGDAVPPSDVEPTSEQPAIAEPAAADLSPATESEPETATREESSAEESTLGAPAVDAPAESVGQRSVAAPAAEVADGEVPAESVEEPMLAPGAEDADGEVRPESVAEPAAVDADGEVPAESVGEPAVDEPATDVADAEAPAERAEVPPAEADPVEPEGAAADAEQSDLAASTADHDVTADHAGAVETGVDSNNATVAGVTAAEAGTVDRTPTNDRTPTTDRTPPVDPTPVAAANGPFPAGSNPAKEQHRRSTTWIAGAAAVAVVVVLVVVLAIVLGNSSGHKADKPAVKPPSTSLLASTSIASATGPATTTPSPVQTPSTGPAVPAQTALSRWALANLSKKTVIAADAVSGQTLKSAGFTSVVSDNATDVDFHAVAFLIRNRNLGDPSPFRTKLAAASSPIALFGTGAQEITVSQVYPDLGSGLSAALAHDRALRKDAGSQLVENPNLKFSPTAKRTVQAGGLDMRAAAVLVLLAKTSPVYVIDIVADPAEARASRPSRTIVISTGNLNMVQQTLSSVGLDYHPARVQVIDQNAIQMQWIPAIVPVAGG